MGCCASQDDGQGKERKHEMLFYCHGLDLLIADIPRMTWGPAVISWVSKPNRKSRHDGWELSELTDRRRNIDRPPKKIASAWMGRRPPVTQGRHLTPDRERWRAACAGPCPLGQRADRKISPILPLGDDPCIQRCGRPERSCRVEVDAIPRTAHGPHRKANSRRSPKDVRR